MRIPAEEYSVEVERKHHTLSQLAASLSSQIAKTYSTSYWIVAEISKLNHYPQSGHCYPQLVEKRNGKIVADMRGFIGKNIYERARMAFKETTGNEMADGMQLLFRCKLGFHAVYGLSVNILEVEPSFTLGEMARLRRDAIQKLRSLEVFDLNKILNLALLPKRIAVISVETSKGFSDFMQTLSKSRFSKAIETRLFPALLQGDAAVESIQIALGRIQQIQHSFDAVAIIRGGGGETGLDCYDNFELARAVSLFPLPVITGIGHATNLTVVEQVAHKNMITPTDLARFIIDRFLAFADRLDHAEQVIFRLQKSWFRTEVALLSNFEMRLKGSFQKQIADAHTELGKLANTLKDRQNDALASSFRLLGHRLPSALYHAAIQLISQERTRIKNSRRNIEFSQYGRLERNRHRLATAKEQLRLLDPINALKRGYSITTVNGKVIKENTNLPEGTEIKTLLYKGSLVSKLIESKDGEEGKI